MSQVNHPTFSLPMPVRGMPARWFAAMIGVTAVAGVSLTLAIGGDPAATTSPSSVVSGPNEASVAASIGGSSAAVTGSPDESRVAASIGGSSAAVTSSPDESRIAASVAGR